MQNHLRNRVPHSEECAEVLRIEPEWTIEGTSKRVNGFKFPEHAAHFFDYKPSAGPAVSLEPEA